MNIDNTLTDPTTDTVAFIAAGGDINAQRFALRVDFYINGN